MRLTKGKKNFIKAKHQSLSVEELAKQTKLTKEEILNYLETLKTPMVERQSAYKIASISDITRFIKENRFFLFFLAFVTFIVSCNCLNGDFISDDIPGIVENPFTPLFLKSVKTLLWIRISNTVIFHIFGLNPIPFHLVSILLHIMVATLLFIFLGHFFSKKISLISATLFALHPVNSEAVMWISGRSYIFTAGSLLAILIVYLMYMESKKRIYLIISILIFIAELILTRTPQSLVIPLVLLTVDQMFIREKINLKSTAKILPFFLISIAFLLFIRNRVEFRTETVGSKTATAPYHIRVPYSTAESLKLLVLPSDLTLYHEGGTVSQLVLILMFLTTVSLVFLTFYLSKKNRKAAGLILFGVSSILYVYSPIQVAWFVAERYLYIASMAFCTGVAMIFFGVEKKYKIRDLSLIIAIIFASIYLARTFIRTFDWKDQKSLWEATARVSPNSHRVYNNLGDVYAKENDWERSIAAFKKSMAINPNFAPAYHNLGHTYILIGKYDLAEKYLLKSYEMDPSLFQALYHLGTVEYSRGNMEKAIDYMEETLKLVPNYTPAIKSIEVIKSKM